MKNSTLYYSVGPLLYCPANNETVADSIINQRFGNKFSLALCLEDTIQDNCIQDAEQKLINSINKIYIERENKDFYLPKIFIRIRNTVQLLRLNKAFTATPGIITGFILPKFSLENADEYIQTIIKVNETSQEPVYTMPIYENSSIIDLRTRHDILYTLKDKLTSIEKLVLNIRVGGNDLCHMFGFRRHSNESIHKIKPISNIFSDIITVYGMDYVISGPVWEYYNGNNWKTGLENELIDDRLCGFIGKTVIHPNQIDVINEAYKVSSQDLEDAKAILNWDESSASLVSGSTNLERMNEYKTHSNWALQTILQAEAYGIKSLN